MWFRSNETPSSNIQGRVTAAVTQKKNQSLHILDFVIMATQR